MAALVAAFAFRRYLGAELSLFTGLSHPTEPEEWLALLGAHPLVGLTFLNLFDVVDYALVGLMILAACAALARTHKGGMAIAASLAVMGAVVNAASNMAFPMLALSGQYASATEIGKGQIVSAARAILAISDPGGDRQAFGTYVAILTMAASGLIVSIAMLRSPTFGRWFGCIGILASAFIMTWHIIVGLRLLRLRKGEGTQYSTQAPTAGVSE